MRLDEVKYADPATAKVGDIVIIEYPATKWCKVSFDIAEVFSADRESLTVGKMIFRETTYWRDGTAVHENNQSRIISGDKTAAVAWMLADDRRKAACS